MTLAVEPGQLVAVAGRGGSGRTSLLLTLAGRMRPTGGSARVAGHALPGAAVRRVWVFGLLAYLMLRPVAGEALASRLSAWSVALGAWLPAALLGALGALLLYLVLDLGLGLDPEQPLGLIGTMVLASRSTCGVTCWCWPDRSSRCSRSPPGRSRASASGRSRG